MAAEEILQLEISGMTCDHCAVSIEKLLGKVNGVKSAKVEYTTGRGECAFDPHACSAEEVVGAINATRNYRAQVVAPLKPAAAHSKGTNGAAVETFDLIIIGGGSAAFSAAIAAENAGRSTLMVNAGYNFGGTCVNVGCVPSKNLIRAAETVHRAHHSPFAGVQVHGASVDFAQVIRDKKALVQDLQQKKYLDVVADFGRLKMLTGWAEFVDAYTIEVEGLKYRADKILIATGASTHVPDIPGLREVGFLTHATLFDLEEKPASLTIMGAGYIGLEIAQAYSRLGVKVRIIEFTDRVLRTQTPDVSEAIAHQLKGEGIEILPGYRVLRFEKRDGVTVMECRTPDGSVKELVEPGKIVVASGTRPNTARLKLENAGVKTASSGHIEVNAYMQTSEPHIYAAGDVANTPAYVYTAAYEGRIAVENAFRNAAIRVDYSALPWVVFTDPQVAGVGLDEAQAAAEKIPHEVSKIALDNVPRALAAHDTRGFIKLIRNPETDLLLGARVVAPEGGELITMLAMAMRYQIPVKNLAEDLYPYLTLSEGVKIAAIAFGKDVHKLSCCAS